MIKLGYLLLFYNLLFSQSLLLDFKDTPVYSVSGSYYLAETHNNRNYNLSMSFIWKNILRSSITYYSNDALYDYTSSPSSLSTGLHFNKNSKIKYSIYLHNYYLSNYYKDKKFINSISINFFNIIKSNNDSGMDYYPYIKYERYTNNLDENINYRYDMFAYDDFLYIGCTIALDKYWFKPFYKITIDGNNIIYSGLEFGIWNIIK